MINETTLVDYRYLNLDTKKFVNTQEELIKQIPQGHVKAIPNIHGQVLMAASKSDFTECEAIIKCKRLTGMLNVRTTKQ